MFEPLENRVLLTATLTNGHLLLTTVFFPDVIVVSATADPLFFAVDISNEGFHAEYRYTEVTSLEIRANQGGDDDTPGTLISVTPMITVPTLLVGSPHNDLISGGNGNTTVLAGDGDDVVSTGIGDDSIEGGGGADFISAGAGNDTVDGGDGRDADDDADPAIAAGDDTILGGEGDDLLMGGGSPTIMVTAPVLDENGDPVLDENGDPETEEVEAFIGDILLGQDGNDTLIGGEGRDLMDGGTGTNLLSYRDKAVDVNVVFPDAVNPNFRPADPIDIINFPLIGFGEVEEVDDVFVVIEHDQLYDGLETVPSLTYDDVTADAAAPLSIATFQQIEGGDGHDLLDVSLMAGPFTIFGNDGVDSILGSPGDDFIDAGDNSGAGRDGLNFRESSFGNAGNDTILGNGGTDDVFGGPGNDSLDGGAGSDIVRGGDGDDTLSGGTGNDLLTGGNGDDLLLGELEDSGADTLQGDAGIDTADYTMRTTATRITFDSVHDDGAFDVDGDPTTNDPEQDFVTETTEIGLGGSGNDFLDGRIDGSARTLNGGGGDDTLMSGLGAEDLIGGDGIDTVSYANRTNPVNASINGVADDGEAGEGDNIHSTVEILIGGSGNDTLTGSNADETLEGGAGADVINGMGGNDTVDYSGRTTGVSVTTDGVANDGEAGEGDNLINVEVIIGSPQNDFLSTAGSTVSTTLLGGAGDDTVEGGTGADSLSGGPGIDTLTYASRSNNLVITINSTTNVGTEAGDNDVFDGTFETIIAGNGNDRISIVNVSKGYNLQGLGGNDTVSGGIGADTIDGGAGNDSISAGAGADTVFGNNGNDTLRGGSGDDTLGGGNGDDWLDGQGGADRMIGNAGNDTATYADRDAPVTVRMDTLFNDGEVGEGDLVDATTVETVLGGRGNDMLIATGMSTGVNFDGRAGNDTLIGGNGPDTFNGNLGNDSLSGSNGNDLLNGYSGNDTLVGNAGNDTLNGGDNNDRLLGGDGNDDLNGDAGHDTLDGGNGADDFDGGPGNDTATYASRSTNLNIVVDNVANDGAPGENDNVRTSIETVIAGSGHDTLSGGTSPAIRIFGGAGNDTITGGTGPDVLQGDAGNDSIVGGAGSDTLYGTNGNDTLIGGDAGDRILGGAGNDVIRGEGGNDTLVGGAGSDTFSGGAGIDLVTYYYETRPVNASINRIADDGVRGENDDIQIDVENLEGGSGNDTLAGSTGSGSIFGGPGNDLIYGNDGNDTLNGGPGADTLDGGNGNDVLIGGPGPDRLIGNRGIDTADYSASTAAVRLSLDDLANDGATGEFDKLDSDIEILLGGSGNDSITGGAGSQTLNGGPGNDTLRGGPGDDSLIGGPGLDSVFGDAGADTLDLTDGQADSGDGGVDGDIDIAFQDFGLDTVVNIP